METPKSVRRVQHPPHGGGGIFNLSITVDMMPFQKVRF
jgi:hypothetical protein